MMWIELHDDNGGYPLMIQTDHIDYISVCPPDNTTVVRLSGNNTLYIKESFEDVCKLLKRGKK